MLFHLPTFCLNCLPFHASAAILSRSPRYVLVPSTGQHKLSQLPPGFHQILHYRFCLRIVMDMDFADIFMEELASQKILSPLWGQAITLRTVEWVDQPSNPVDPTHRPARRWLPPSEQEIEPPVLPMEHWLLDEQLCQAWVEMLSNDMIVCPSTAKASTRPTPWIGRPSRYEFAARCAVA
jgi:hypothetical protein